MDPLASARLVQEQVWAVDKDQPIADIVTMEDLVAYKFVSQRVTANFILAFAAAALLLAAIGIYGMLSYSAGQRRREIGIRIALGARQSDIARSITTETFMLAGAGVAIGFVLSLGFRKVLAFLLYGVGPADPVTFFVVSMLLTGIAVAAGYLPTRQATRVDPMVALRNQ